jgi:hypothetical protein
MLANSPTARLMEDCMCGIVHPDALIRYRNARPLLNAFSIQEQQITAIVPAAEPLSLDPENHWPFFAKFA